MNSINKILISLITIEIVFGGGGRLLDNFGIPPLRYILFACAIALFMLNMILRNTQASYKSAIIIFSIISLPLYGALSGVIFGNKTDSIIFDLQPYVYMLIIFYICTLNETLTEYSLSFFISTVKVFSIFASLIYISYIVLLKIGLVSFPSIYNTLSSTSEFFFRPGGAFFAKSFFFLGIGAIFYFIEKKYIPFIFIMIASFLTETRGVVLFTGVAIIIASFRVNGVMKNAIYITAAVLAVLLLMIVVGDRAGSSDSVRINDLSFIINSMDWLSSIFGNGFGSQVNDRGRIEIVPLELFYKTGFLGILLSLAPILIISINQIFKKYTIRGLQISCALIFSAGVSMTNPFIYTPMGIFVIAMAVNSFRKEY